MNSLDANGLFFVCFALFSIAILYSMVGHGGASGYIAVMTLFGLAPAVVKPTALVLNILVALVASYTFIKAGQFRWRLFWPFALTSIPASYFGGAMILPEQYYRPLLGIALLFAAIRLFVLYGSKTRALSAPALPLALLLGVGIGFLSGLTGVGGGIFLSPVLLVFGWATVREASGVAALFILCNSAAGLLGHFSHMPALPEYLPWIALAATGGGIIGSFLGSIRLPLRAVVNVLGAVLIIAGCKLILI